MQGASEADDGIGGKNGRDDSSEGNGVAGGWGAAWDTTSEDGVCSRLVHMSGNDEGGE